MKSSLTHRLRQFFLYPECIEWVDGRIKVTTFQSRKYSGLYEIVTGSRFKRKKTGKVVRITPIEEMDGDTVIVSHFRTEGPFGTAADFIRWLKSVGLVLHEMGWLHKIERDRRALGTQLEEDGVKI